MDKDKLTETRFAQKLAEEDARARKLVAAGDFGEAASIYKEILADPIIDRIADISLLTKISLFPSNASFTLVDAGLPEQALETAKKALTVAARTGEIYPLARYHFILSLVQYRKGDLNEAEANLLQAIRGFEAVDRKRDIGHCLNNLGRIYEERGLPEKGAEYHRQAVELRETLPDKGEYAFSLGNLGVALLSAGKLKDAEKYLKKCLSSYGQAGLDSRPEYAAFARNLEICEETLSPKQ